MPALLQMLPMVMSDKLCVSRRLTNACLILLFDKILRALLGVFIVCSSGLFDNIISNFVGFINLIAKRIFGKILLQDIAVCLNLSNIKSKAK